MDLYSPELLTAQENLLFFLQNDSDPNNASGNFGSKGTAKLTGYKQAGTPQQAFSVGFEYRNPKFWWIGANANYIAENYIDVSVVRRTESYFTSDDNFVPLSNPKRLVYPIDQDKVDGFLEQEKFDPIRLVNLVGGKSWRISGKYNVALFVNVSNILDIKYRTGGFEQSRNSSYKQDYQDRFSGGPLVFGSKYFNGYGRTYSANISLTF